MAVHAIMAKPIAPICASRNHGFMRYPEFSQRQPTARIAATTSAQMISPRSGGASLTPVTPNRAPSIR